MEDGSIHILRTTDGGASIIKPLKPKNASEPLELALLSDSRVPMVPISGPVSLAWADNESSDKPRTLGMTKVSGISVGKVSNSFSIEGVDSDDELDQALDEALDQNQREKKGIMGIFPKKKQDSPRKSDDLDIDTSSNLWDTVANDFMKVREEAYPDGDFYASNICRECNDTASQQVVSHIILGTRDAIRLYNIGTNRI